MRVLGYLSDFLLPLILFYIVAFGVSCKRPVYDDFVGGAKEGMKTVAGILPTLVGLMVGVSVLRSSGFLEAVSRLLGTAAEWIHIPSDLVPLILVRMFSASAANGLVVDLFQEFGPDSFVGRAASLIMSSTETIFYTLSVYGTAAGIRKTRWTLAGALLAMAVGIVVSVVLARQM